MIDRLLLCNRKRTTYDSLVIEEGTIRHAIFDPICAEYFPFCDYPELMGLHDGHGWNIPEVANLLNEWKMPADYPGFDEVHVILSKADMDLLATVGLEIA
jgi:hypothetical protein